MSNLKNKTACPRWYIDFFSPKIHKQDVLSWSIAPVNSNAFSNLFTRGYRLSECRAWYLLTHSLLLSVFCVGNLTRFAALSRTISASSTHAKISCTFHEIFRRCYFAYTKLKEDSFFFWPRTYLRLLSCLIRTAPHSATQRRTALIAA